jgi:hypothetical protein
MKLWSFSLWKQEFEKSVALERTVTMADECARTLKSNNPPSIVLNHYIKYDTLVSSELLLVVNATSISIDNVIEVWFRVWFLTKTTHILPFWWVFLPLYPFTSSIGSYDNVIQWLIVEVNDNSPLGMTGMTAIIVMVWRTDGAFVLKMIGNGLIWAHWIKMESNLHHTRYDKRHSTWWEMFTSSLVRNSCRFVPLQKQQQ